MYSIFIWNSNEQNIALLKCVLTITFFFKWRSILGTWLSHLFVIFSMFYPHVVATSKSDPIMFLFHIDIANGTNKNSVKHRIVITFRCFKQMPKSRYTEPHCGGVGYKYCKMYLPKNTTKTTQCRTIKIERILLHFWVLYH